MLRKWIIPQSQNDLVVFFKVNPSLLIEVFLKFGLASAEQTQALCAGIRQENCLYLPLYFPFFSEYCFLRLCQVISIYGTDLEGGI